ncbi:MAG: hypothetical protein ACREEW_13965 [Caulobacteraceae bacterium]
MTAPPIVPRPALAQWMFERDMTLRQAAAFFGAGYETLRRATLPLADPAARPPNPALMRRIIARTAGQVRADDWYAAAEVAA